MPPLIAASADHHQLLPTLLAQVRILTAPSPSKAQPFLHSYGSDLSNKNPLVLWASTLVMRVPKAANTWAVVTNPTGPAECFLKSTTDQCS